MNCCSFAMICTQVGFTFCQLWVCGETWDLRSSPRVSLNYSGSELEINYGKRSSLFLITSIVRISFCLLCVLSIMKGQAVAEEQELLCYIAKEESLFFPEQKFRQSLARAADLGLCLDMEIANDLRHLRIPKKRLHWYSRGTLWLTESVVNWAVVSPVTPAVASLVPLLSFQLSLLVRSPFAGSCFMLAVVFATFHLHWGNLVVSSWHNEQPAFLLVKCLNLFNVYMHRFFRCAAPNLTIPLRKKEKNHDVNRSTAAKLIVPTLWMWPAPWTCPETSMASALWPKKDWRHPCPSSICMYD